MNLSGKSYNSILVISDQHIPYNHPDLVPFLKKIKQKHCPDLIVNIGDELDYHSISFHEKDPELFSAGEELKKSIAVLKKIYKIFPKMILLESNHGSLVYRKQKYHGLPAHVFKSYSEILESPKGWSWVCELIVKIPNGQSVYFHHGKSKKTMAVGQQMGMNVVQGHFHEDFSINYWSSPFGLYWQMQVGCLIDKKSLAFAYNTNNIKRPIIGLGIIKEGKPQLLPMPLNKNGRWSGNLP